MIVIVEMEDYVLEESVISMDAELEMTADLEDVIPQSISASKD